MAERPLKKLAYSIEIKKHKTYLGVRGPSMKGRGKDGIVTKRYNTRGLFKSKK